MYERSPNPRIDVCTDKPKTRLNGTEQLIEAILCNAKSNAKSNVKSNVKSNAKSDAKSKFLFPRRLDCSSNDLAHGYMMNTTIR